ncbi:DUF6787 family protein [Dokdonia sp. Hel_I_53]|uniref:DUF6787 family protein n=1 Tax=Dokdonia sp. Hel_I_53 TaxID=1566287 RepID=UPI00119903D7|nr:DUF6787 family protein [Dokdonia sp. Hel_I_53]TVZ51052.1 hypothetical protein OD90_0188 [Dokdonia sp. Hel_I_53]
MKNFKKRWEITQNWQFIHIILGLIATLFSAYLISRVIINNFFEQNSIPYFFVLILGILIISFLIIKLTLWLFSKLYKRWGVTYRWELIAMFLVFAITGSTAGKLSDPLMELVGLDKTVVSGWIYWPVRILLIFPIYQVLLVFFGWIFGQFAFFKAFAIKMVSRIGLGFLFST